MMRVEVVVGVVLVVVWPQEVAVVAVVVETTALAVVDQQRR